MDNLILVALKFLFLATFQSSPKLKPRSTTAHEPIIGPVPINSYFCQITNWCSFKMVSTNILNQPRCVYVGCNPPVVLRRQVSLCFGIGLRKNLCLHVTLLPSLEFAEDIADAPKLFYLEYIFNTQSVMESTNQNCYCGSLDFHIHNQSTVNWKNDEIVGIPPGPLTRSGCFEI